MRRAISEAAIALGADFKDRELAVLLTDDKPRCAGSTRNGAASTSRPTCCRFRRPQTSRLDAAKSLGDIAIAYETTAREAVEEAKPFADHLSHLAVHGFLHLLGYDHETESQAGEMERLERVILARLGVPDPYSASESLVRQILGADTSPCRTPTRQVVAIRSSRSA